MQKICGFLAVVLTLLAFSCMFPHNAYASEATDLKSKEFNCDEVQADGKTINQKVADNRARESQERFIAAVNLSVLYPINSAWNKCVDNIMKAMMALPKFGDPFGVAVGLVVSMLTSVLTQQCSEVLGFIDSVQNTILGYTNICMPMPDFNPRSLPRVTGGRGPCKDGSVSLQTLTSFQPPTSSDVNYKQFQRKLTKPKAWKK